MPDAPKPSQSVEEQPANQAGSDPQPTVNLTLSESQLQDLASRVAALNTPPPAVRYTLGTPPSTQASSEGLTLEALEDKSVDWIAANATQVNQLLALS